MEIVYRRLADIKPNPKNPRKATRKAIENLAKSIEDNPMFFEARPILLSDRTGEWVIIGGEQRSKAAALLGLEKVPTILFTGISEEQEDYILANDNLHAGVWDEQKLALWPQERLVQWGVVADWKREKEDKYTRKIESPVYEIKGEKPDVSELVDTKKRDELVERIRAEKLPKEVREFLLMAAERHLVFDYEKIAEFYAQSPARVQRLFEDSALVIIDFNDAIGGGYVKLCKDLIEQYEVEKNG